MNRESGTYLKCCESANTTTRKAPDHALGSGPIPGVNGVSVGRTTVDNPDPASGGRGWVKSGQLIPPCPHPNPRPGWGFNLAREALDWPDLGAMTGRIDPSAEVLNGTAGKRLTTVSRFSQLVACLFKDPVRPEIDFRPCPTCPQVASLKHTLKR